MSDLDIAATTVPRSDQQNFDDYVAGPKTVTISEVKKGSAEQPVEVHLVEFPVARTSQRSRCGGFWWQRGVRMRPRMRVDG